MKSFLFLACVFLLIAQPAPAQEDDMGKANQKPHSFERSISKTVHASYLLFLPESYKKGDSRQWPLMLFLHGAGERGTNLNKVAVHGPPKVVKTRPDFPFIVISPQCPNGEVWNNDVLLSLLDEVSAKYQVDSKRVYLTGLSMGGFGTWNLGLSYPDRFAAIAPICGGGDILKILLADPRKLPALKALPIWVFHGAKDPVVHLEESERMIKALKSIGNTARSTIYPEAGHDSWTEAYNTQELYDWFLQHERSAADPKPK
jgi:predicted peptidase